MIEAVSGAGCKRRPIPPGDSPGWMTATPMNDFPERMDRLPNWRQLSLATLAGGGTAAARGRQRRKGTAEDTKICGSGAKQLH